jgi:hypothetical protein
MVGCPDDGAPRRRDEGSTLPTLAISVSWSKEGGRPPSLVDRGNISITWRSQWHAPAGCVSLISAVIRADAIAGFVQFSNRLAVHDDLRPAELLSLFACTAQPPFVPCSRLPSWSSAGLRWLWRALSGSRLQSCRCKGFWMRFQPAIPSRGALQQRCLACVTLPVCLPWEHDLLFQKLHSLSPVFNVFNNLI